MGHRYIAIIGPQGASAERIDAIERLRARGLVERARSQALVIFATAETPVVQLPGGSLVVGHVFTRDGATTDLPALVAREPTHEHLRKAVLRDCWGEYLLIQPAQAVWDGLAITRDPSGAVGCLHAFEDGAGFLTSDISLAADLGLYAARIDWQQVERCLTFPHLPGADTTLAGISELLPGSTLRLTRARTTTTESWSPWTFTAADARFSDSHEASAAVRAAVSTAVRTLASLDVSVLLELSGGLDSSIVAACLRDSGPKVAAFTAVTPVPGADERQYANHMAKVLGVELLSESLAFDLARYDAPPPPHAATPRIAALQHASNAVFTSAADAQGTTSFFSGAGGDAVFCYLRTAAPAVDAFRERGVRAGMTALHELAELHECTVWKAATLTARKLCRAPSSPYKANRRFLAGDDLPATPVHPWSTPPAGTLPGDRERVHVLSGSQTFRECTPRGQARWMRMPLISQPVMEACLRTPSWMWIAGGMNRAVARRAFADLLPAPVLNRRSKGSFMTWSGAVYRRSRDGITPFLLDGELASRGLLDRTALADYLQRDLAPRDESFMRVFELCMVESWVRHHPG